MNKQITIRYKNSHGETHTDNLTRAEAVELYLSLAVDLYSHVMKTPPKSGAPKETNYASH